MQDLCSAGNMSERSLHRLFAHHLGENVTDYLGRLRIGRVCMWLVETDRPISVIAADVGFSNLSNFNRRFRAVRHMTPKEFRRQYSKHTSLPALDEFSTYKALPVAGKNEGKKRRIPRARLLPVNGCTSSPRSTRRW